MFITILIAYLVFGIASTSTISVLSLYLLRRNGSVRLAKVNEVMSLTFILFLLTCMVIDFGGVSRLIVALKNQSSNSITGITITLIATSIILHIFLFLNLYFSVLTQKIISNVIVTLAIFNSIIVVIYISQLQSIFTGDSYFSFIIGNIAFVLGMFFFGSIFLYITCKVANTFSEKISNSRYVEVAKKQVFSFSLIFIFSLFVWILTA